MNIKEQKKLCDAWEELQTYCQKQTRNHLSIHSEEDITEALNKLELQNSTDFVFSYYYDPHIY